MRDVEEREESEWGGGKNKSWPMTNVAHSLHQLKLGTILDLTPVYKLKDERYIWYYGTKT